MRTKTTIAAVVATMLAVQPGFAQSLNIDFGSDANVPPSSYGAAGLSGEWNNFGVLPTSERHNLVGLDGQPISGRIYNIGGADLLASNDPETSGSHEALLDDMLTSDNDPVDACIFFENLVNGTYDVLIYALTPNDPQLRSRVRVDFATPGPTMVGGTWQGRHQTGVSYQRFRVGVSNGRMGLHSGLFGGNIRSGINGIQLIRLVTCPAEMNGDGIVDTADLLAYLALWFEGHPDAERSGDDPAIINIVDLLQYVSDWLDAPDDTGCL